MILVALLRALTAGSLPDKESKKYLLNYIVFFTLNFLLHTFLNRHTGIFFNHKLSGIHTLLVLWQTHFKILLHGPANNET